MSNILVRYAVSEDAEQFVELQKILTIESEYLLSTCDEVARMVVDKQRQQFVKMSSGELPSRVIVAVSDNDLIGFLGFTFNQMNKNRHVVSRIAIGVINKFKRKGVATSLLKFFEQSVSNSGVSRIEFNVISTNLAALSLYLKYGYKIEGVRQKSVLQNTETFVDEYYIAKLL
ncbi:MAG: GNAT family N-acetyltransferase [Flavipsychrobacter sp.]|nr:GNAT family N-acetyltransferase [Flavipsychrobacter sp.]